MSGFKSFVLAGAGNIGKFLADELLAAKQAGTVASVTILTRPESASSEANAAFAAKGAKIVGVDYTDAGSLAAHLSGVDVVVSTLAGSTFATAQIELAKAAKSAGVKLFVPSEFGSDTLGATEGAFGEKAAVVSKLRELELPYTLFFTGSFSDYIFIPPLGFEFADGKVTIWGDGTSKNSFTLRADIAQYTVAALTQWPAKRLQNRVVRIEGELISFNDIVAAYERKSGRKLEVKYKPISEREEVLKANPADFLSFLLILYNQGKGTSSEKDGSNDNAEVDGFKPKKVVDVLLG